MFGDLMQGQTRTRTEHYRIPRIIPLEFKIRGQNAGCRFIRFMYDYNCAWCAKRKEKRNSFIVSINETCDFPDSIKS
jgi:hypothetical protein